MVLRMNISCLLPMENNRISKFLSTILLSPFIAMTTKLILGGFMSWSL